MSEYISLLRGINVSGQKKILMKDLRELYEDLGFENVASYVQSGNVVFSTNKQANEELSKQIKEGIARAFNFDVPTLVRDKAYFEHVINSNPFLEQTKQDLKMPYVLFLDAEPSEDLVNTLEKPKNETAKFSLDKDVIYITYPDGAGRSKLTTNFFERKLKTSATMRNWKTVLALFDMVQA